MLGAGPGHPLSSTALNPFDSYTRNPVVLLTAYDGLMSHESDALLEYIAQQVQGRVPPDQERLVIELVARTLTMMMSTPDFVNRLLIVQQLNQEVYLLQQALLAQQRKAPPRKPAARKPPVKKATKKAAVKMGPVKVAKRRPVPRGTNKAFKKGAAGL